MVARPSCALYKPAWHQADAAARTPLSQVKLATVVKRLDQGFLGLSIGNKGLHQLLFCATTGKGARLVCFDRELTEIKWEMQCSRTLKMAVSKDRELTVTGMQGKGRFMHVQGDAVSHRITDTSLAARPASCIPTPTISTTRRVNLAFADSLEDRGGGL